VPPPSALPPLASATRTLGARALGALRWGGLGAVGGALLQVGATAALARLLAPADFGRVALALLALRLFSYFSQLGLGAALVQRERLTAQDVRLALGLTWVVSAAGALGAAAASPLLAWFFGSPGLGPLLLALAPTLLVSGLGNVPTALLRRDLRFRELTLVETGAYAVGYGLVGVSAALAGWGVWSLVATAWAQPLLSLAGGWALTRHPLRPTLRGDRAGLLGYGARHSVVSFLEFLAAGLDTAVVGRLLGEATLGLYNRAMLLTSQPVERAAGVVARVLFPLLSAVQGDRRKVGGAFLLSVALVGVFGGALSLGVSAAAADVVLALLGPRWVEAAPVVEVLALAVPLAFMSQLAGVTCDALALLRFKLKVQGLALAALALLMIGLAPGGARGVAWALVAGEALRLTIYLVFLGRELGCARADVGRILGAVGAAGALAYAACGAASAQAARWGLAPLPALGLDALAGLVALAAGGLLALRLVEGTAPARLADGSVPGWLRLRRRLGLVGVRT
jgi:O-antigen/teichoic acid export membrane protein